MYLTIISAALKFLKNNWKLVGLLAGLVLLRPVCNRIFRPDVPVPSVIENKDGTKTAVDKIVVNPKKRTVVIVDKDGKKHEEYVKKEAEIIKRPDGTGKLINPIWGFSGAYHVGLAGGLKHPYATGDYELAYYDRWGFSLGAAVPMKNNLRLFDVEPYAAVSYNFYKNFCGFAAYTIKQNALVGVSLEF